MPWNQKAVPALRSGSRNFLITDADFAGPLLTLFGQVHRAQVTRNFDEEAAMGVNPWLPLSPAYAEWKRRFLGRRGKILQLSGEGKDRLTKRNRPEYIQEFQPPGLFRFGADVGVNVKGKVVPYMAYHLHGTDTLPRRDFLSKSPDDALQFRQALVAWYRTVRIPQAMQGMAKLAAAARPLTRAGASALIAKAKSVSSRVP